MFGRYDGEAGGREDGVVRKGRAGEEAAVAAVADVGADGEGGEGVGGEGAEAVAVEEWLVLVLLLFWLGCRVVVVGPRLW